MTKLAAQRPIDVAFCIRHTVTVARELIGCILVRDIAGVPYAGTIVETEAYREDDPASHSYRGPTKRCRVMFGPPGVAYVYRSYGVHHCLNVVTEAEGKGCAVLIRAVEPLGKLEELWDRRFPETAFNPKHCARLTNGPGKLTQAFSITVDQFNGHRLDSPPLTILQPSNVAALLKNGSKRTGARDVRSYVRIGITKGVERRWRFCDAASEYVSRRSGRVGNAC